MDESLTDVLSLTDVTVGSKSLANVVIDGIRKYSREVVDKIVRLKNTSWHYLKNISLTSKKDLFLSTSAVVFLMSTAPGCMSQRIVDEQLALTPKYFQNNVGKAHVLPFYSAILPLSGGPVGWMNISDPNGSYTLTALANKDNALHEAFHSYDLRTALKDIPRDELPAKLTTDFLKKHVPSEEWQKFVYDFCQEKPPKPNLPIYLLCMTVPLVKDIPIPGYVNLYSLSTGGEDAAECFVDGIRGKKRNNKELIRKRDIVMDYASGKYATKEDSTQQARR